MSAHSTGMLQYSYSESYAKTPTVLGNSPFVQWKTQQCRCPRSSKFLILVHVFETLRDHFEKFIFSYIPYWGAILSHPSPKARATRTLQYHPNVQLQDDTHLHNQSLLTAPSDCPQFWMSAIYQQSWNLLLRLQKPYLPQAQHSDGLLLATCPGAQASYRILNSPRTCKAIPPAIGCFRKSNSVCTHT